MRNAISMLCLLLTSAVSGATVEDHFGAGIFNARWGTTLGDLKSAYPGGYLWPIPEKGSYTTNYSVEVKEDLFGIGVANPRVSFGFDRNDRLIAAWVHFPYERRDALLLRIEQLLGHEDEKKSERLQTVYGWSSGSVVRVKLLIGNSRLYDWVMLGVRAKSSEADKQD